MRGKLIELEQNLESTGADHASANVDDRARGVLLLLVRRAISQSQFPEPTEAKVSECPNCGLAPSTSRSPYCSEECRCEAAFVRQTRAGLAVGTILDSGRQVAFGENAWKLLGGLYPRRQEMVLARAMSRVMKRTSGKCETCGKPATTVDHIGSG